MADLVFGLNGTLQRVSNAQVDPTLRLVDYLRDTQRLRGTKVSCEEGKCGCCDVLLSKWDPTTQTIVSQCINSCLRLLVSCHGQHITTVEGIGGSQHPSGYSAVQTRFAQLNASQCGYCTPGFVVALSACLLSKPRCTMADIEHCFDGNLCRCTGYRPILDAAKSFACDTTVVDHINQTKVSVENEECTDALRACVDRMFPSELKSSGTPTDNVYHTSRCTYMCVSTLQSLVRAVASARPNKCCLVVGHTGVGIDRSIFDAAQTYLDVSAVPQLRVRTSDDKGATLGGALTMTECVQFLMSSEGINKSTTQRNCAVAEFFTQLGNIAVRNASSIGGNLSMTKERGFSSDIATALCAAGAKVAVLELRAEKEPAEAVLPLIDWLQGPSPAGTISLVVSVTIPVAANGEYFSAFRLAMRAANSRPIINAAFRALVTDDGKLLDIVAFYGGIGERGIAGRNAPRRHKLLESYLQGKMLGAALLSELSVSFPVDRDFVCDTERLSQRLQLVKAFAQKFVESASTAHGRMEKQHEVTSALHSGVQEFTVDNDFLPVGSPIPRPEGKMHAAGESVYVSDVNEAPNTLYAAWVLPNFARGKVKKLEIEQALQLPGVVRFIGERDLPSWCPNKVENSFRAFGVPIEPILDYPLFSNNIESPDQGVGIILAKTLHEANSAARFLHRTMTSDVERPVVTIADAVAKGQAAVFEVPICKGDPLDDSIPQGSCEIQFNVHTGSQRHFYMETHAAYAVREPCGLVVHYMSQFPEFLPRAISKFLGMQENEVRCVQMRTGGSFGAKVAADDACAVAVACVMLKCPVKMHMDRETDMQVQGGREDVDCEVKVRFLQNGKISGITFDMKKNVGVRLDASLFALHGRGIAASYDVPSVHGKATAFTSNTTNRTTMRGPGEPESAAIIEEVIDRVAAELGVHSQVVREANLLTEQTADEEGVTTPISEFTFREMYHEVMDGPQLWRKRVEDSIEFNARSRYVKRGVAIVPFNYSVSVTRQNVQINILRDGSVVVFHSGVEVGQGLQLKVLQMVNHELAQVVGPLPMSLFRSAGNDSFVLPNQNCTGGSTTSEGNVLAAQTAARELAQKLKDLLSKMSPEDRSAKASTWKELIQHAVSKRVNLAAVGQYDGKGQLAYNIFIVGAAEVTLDALTGQVTVERFDMSYDAGQSLNPAIDIGQIEGGAVMGLGFMLLEEGENDSSGLLPHSTDYMIPTVMDTPKRMSVTLVHNRKFTRGVGSSKANGEPPMTVSSALLSATRQAILSVRRDNGLKGLPELSIPYTAEKVLEACTK